MARWDGVGRGRGLCLLWRPTFVLQKSHFGGHGGEIFREDLAQRLLGQTGRRVVKVQDFTGRLQPVLGRHVRVQKPIVFAVDVALERRRAVGQVVWHRYVGQIGLLRITATKTNKHSIIHRPACSCDKTWYRINRPVFWWKKWFNAVQKWANHPSQTNKRERNVHLGGFIPSGSFNQDWLSLLTITVAEIESCYLFHVITNNRLPIESLEISIKNNDVVIVVEIKCDELKNLLDVHFGAKEGEAIQIENGPLHRRRVAHLDHGRTFFRFQEFHLKTHNKNSNSLIQKHCWSHRPMFPIKYKLWPS